MTYLPKLITWLVGGRADSSSGFSAPEPEPLSSSLEPWEERAEENGSRPATAGQADGKRQTILNPRVGFSRGPLEGKAPLRSCRLLLRGMRAQYCGHVHVSRSWRSIRMSHLLISKGGPI